MSSPSAPPLPGDRRFTTAMVLAWAVALGVLGLNEGALVARDPRLARDDQALIQPLQAVSGLGDYLAAVHAGRVLDRQPVRDLSLWLDLGLSRLLGRGTFHATNLLLLVLLLALLARWLTQRLGRTPAVAAGLVLYACHPAVANTVSWIAARKHLLAAVLVLGAAVLEGGGASARRRAGAVACYLLSILAQPITLLFPAWLAFDAWLGGRPARRALWAVAPYAPVAGAVAALNLAYYQGEFVLQTHAAKFTAASEETSGAALLALGRYTFNALCPVAISTSYEPGRAYNLVGELLLPVLLLVAWRSSARRQALAGWGLFLAPLLVVTVRMTNIFVSDTYLLVPLAGVLLAGLAQVEATGARLAVVGVLSVLLAAQSHAVAASWSSDAALWEHAYQTEPTPNVLAKEAYFLTSAGRAGEAREVAARLMEWAPEHGEAAYVYARAVALDPGLSPEQQLALLDAAPVRDPWSDYFAAVTEAKRGRFDAAYGRLGPAAPRAARFAEEAALVAAEAAYFCTRAGRADCAQVGPAFAAAVPPAQWRAERYRQRRQELGLAPGP